MAAVAAPEGRLGYDRLVGGGDDTAATLAVWGVGDRPSSELSILVGVLDEE